MLSIEAQSALRRMRANVADGKWVRMLYHDPITEQACLVGMVENEFFPGKQLDNVYNEFRLYAQSSRIPKFHTTAEEVVVALKRALQLKHNWFSGIQAWNDTQAQSAEEVVVLIDEALQVGSS